MKLVIIRVILLGNAIITLDVIFYEKPLIDLGKMSRVDQITQCDPASARLPCGRLSVLLTVYQ